MKLRRETKRECLKICNEINEQKKKLDKIKKECAEHEQFKKNGN